MPHIKINGVRIFYRFDGPQRAPVLLLSNSLGTDHEMWAHQVSRFTEHFRLLRYDSRGHGQSDAPPGPYSIDGLARDVIALLDELDLDRVSFCGLSMGGMVGIWLGAHAGNRLEKLVLCNTAAQLGPAEMWNERIRIAEQEGLAGLVEPTVQRWLSAARKRASVHQEGRAWAEDPQTDVSLASGEFLRIVEERVARYLRRRS